MAYIRGFQTFPQATPISASKSYVTQVKGVSLLSSKFGIILDAKCYVSSQKCIISQEYDFVEVCLEWQVFVFSSILGVTERPAIQQFKAVATQVCVGRLAYYVRGVMEYKADFTSAQHCTVLQFNVLKIIKKTPLFQHHFLVSQQRILSFIFSPPVTNISMVCRSLSSNILAT